MYKFDLGYYKNKHFLKVLCREIVLKNRKFSFRLYAKECVSRATRKILITNKNNDKNTNKTTSFKILSITYYLFDIKISCFDIDKILKEKHVVISVCYFTKSIVALLCLFTLLGMPV